MFEVLLVWLPQNRSEIVEKLKMQRIKFLDGFRGLAIQMVIFYHAYSRWGNILPKNKFLADFFLFKYGHLGVQLFFMISGFVIFMSIEKNHNFKTFIVKRWLRLFPAMLICATIIALTAKNLYERPNGKVDLSTYFTALFFLSNDFFRDYFNISLGQMEGTFWSLFVEIKFYFIIGIFYYFFNRKTALIAIPACYALWFIPVFLDYKQIIKLPKYYQMLMDILSFSYFGWFSVGMFLYIFWQSNKKIYYIASIILSYFSVIGLLYPEQQAGYWIAGLFLIALAIRKVQIIFENKIIHIVGFISYPLYLIHENAMISLSLKINNHFPNIPNYLIPIAPIMFLMLLAYIISKYLEPPLASLIKSRLTKLNII